MCFFLTTDDHLRVFYKRDLRFIKGWIRGLCQTEGIVITRHRKALLPKHERDTAAFHSTTGPYALRHVSYFSFVTKLSRLDTVLQCDVKQNLACRVRVLVWQAVLKGEIVFVDGRCRRGRSLGSAKRGWRKVGGCCVGGACRGTGAKSWSPCSTSRRGGIPSTFCWPNFQV